MEPKSADFFCGGGGEVLVIIMVTMTVEIMAGFMSRSVGEKMGRCLPVASQRV